MKRILGAALVCAGAVVLADLVLQTTLSRFLWPVVLSPPDGAIAAPPVTVRWEGPQPMIATLSRRGRNEDLGERFSPFEIDASSVSRPGEYRLKLHSPRFGSLVSTQRRFFVGATPAAESPPPTPEPSEDPLDETRREAARLRQERDRVQAERDFLQEQIAKLQRENEDLADTVDELHDDQTATDDRIGVVESQQAELMQEHLAALRENQALRARLESLPACTTWGYISVSRTAAPTRRVIVSNGRGEVFRTERACLLSRRADTTAASTCACVGLVE